MSIRISIGKLAASIGLFLFFSQAACQKTSSKYSSSTLPYDSPSRDNHLSNEIVEMIDGIKLPEHMIQLKKYRRRAEVTSKNLPVIKDWLKQIFKGEKNIHDREVLQGRKEPMTVSPLSAVLPYDVDLRLIQALVSRGANVNEKENVTNTLEISPLGFAFIYASPHVIEWLLNNNEADLGTGHYNENPAAFLLFTFLNKNPNKNYKTAALLVRKLQADQMIKKSKDGNTVLHQFLYNERKSKRNHPQKPERVAIREIWIQLLEECADEFKQCFDEKNSRGQTPLELAKSRRIKKAIEKAAGVNLTSTEESEEIPQMSDNEKIDKLLQASGGKSLLIPQKK